MKPFVRIGHTCRVFLVVGITSLSVFAAITAVLLSSPLPAHAQAYQIEDCQSGWYTDPSGVCRPDGFCPTDQALSYQNHVISCLSQDQNPNTCNPGLTWQNPDDASECLPVSQRCGSASQFDNNLNACVMLYTNVCDYIHAHFGWRG